MVDVTNQSLPSAPPRSRSRAQPLRLRTVDARRIWLRAQRLDEATPFGDGAQATQAAIEHLGYVQIDTINVIERCHHHILFSRIPGYRREHLAQAQSHDKSVFEYWTHALSYVPTRDLAIYRRAMKHDWQSRARWHAPVADAELKRLIRRIERDGALTMRDIDEEPSEKLHLWASRKPSKRVLQLGFYKGQLVISQRTGMLKTYEIAERHFGWDTPPAIASERECLVHRLDSALRAQGAVSLDSICHLNARHKPLIRRIIEQRVRRRELVPVAIDGAGKQEHWASPEALDELGALRAAAATAEPLAHILSPFDPLIIQRKRLKLFFGYEHLFEAYVPKEKRKLGYFALPVLIGDEIVAALDLKTDREQGRLLIQNWTWMGKGRAGRHKRTIETALGRFETFQLAGRTSE